MGLDLMCGNMQLVGYKIVLARAGLVQNFAFDYVLQLIAKLVGSPIL